jgi:rhamnosyltransferase subunit B
VARVVLACWGSYGDLFPSLGLAVRLKAAGHEAVLATCPYYRDLVEAEGVAFRPMRPDIDPADTRLIARLMDPSRGTEIIVRELLVPVVREQHADLVAAAEGADLLVSHPVTFAAPLAAGTLGIRWLSSVLAPASFFSVHDFPLLPPFQRLVRFVRLSAPLASLFRGMAERATAAWMTPVERFRRELGLAAAGHPLFGGQFSPLGTLALFSPLFGLPQPDWPPNATATGFVFYNGRSSMPEDVERFLEAGEPPVVFTLGSAATGAPGRFYEESVAAAASLGRRALLLVGLRASERQALTLPPGMMATEFAPHQALFPRAAAIVHHGGVGTTGQALRSGRPMLVVPHAHDQPDNAFRAERLGVARTLDARKYSARRAADALRRLLADPAYADRAGEVGRTIATEDGAGVAAAVIERIASSSLSDPHRHLPAPAVGPRVVGNGDR